MVPTYVSFTLSWFGAGALSISGWWKRNRLDRTLAEGYLQLLPRFCVPQPDAMIV